MSVPKGYACGLSILTVAAVVWAAPVKVQLAGGLAEIWGGAGAALGSPLTEVVSSFPASGGFRLGLPGKRQANSAGAKAGQETAASGGAADAQAELSRVIAQMDRTANNFHTTQAQFVWTQYISVVDEKDVQKGTVYFRRSAQQVEMAADITEPTPKQVLFSDSKVQMYQPKTGQYNQYDTGKYQGVVESFLVLGFGGSGQDMLKSFTVTYLGKETMDDVAVAKLDLVPKSEKARNTFEHICLWIDLARGVSLQQQMFAPKPDKDYRLASYSHIVVNEKIPDSVFKIRTKS
jgi:outer membrane lipoprotein-sorting protein